MKRHIKFPLFLKDNLPVRTMDELRSNCDIQKLLTYYADGKLAIWLRDRYEDDLYEKVQELNPEKEGFLKKFCELLGVAYDESVRINMREIIDRNEKIKKIKEYTNDAEILDAPERVAFTQEEFEALCRDGSKEKIWLIGKTFALPELKRKVLICGINKPQITISRESSVCFLKTDSKIKDAEYDISGCNIVFSQKEFDMLTDKKEKTIYICAKEIEFKAALYPVKIIGLKPNEIILVHALYIECKNNYVTFENITPKYAKPVIHIGEEIHFAGRDWIVLSDKAPHMLITKESVKRMSHCRNYWDWKSNYSWSNSDIYKWLKSEFNPSKFNDVQKNAILCDDDGQPCTLLSEDDAKKYSQYLRTPYESSMWLNEFYSVPTQFPYSYTYCSLLKTQKESCEIIHPCGVAARGAISQLHDVRPVIYVKDLVKLIEYGEATLCR